MMKSIVFVFVTAFFTMNLNAQDCKWWKNKIDDFTGTSTLANVATVKNNLAYSFSIAFYRIDTIYAVELNYFLNAASAMVAGKDDKAYLKFSDKSVMELSCAYVVDGNIDTSTPITSTLFSPRYSITKAQLRELASKQIEKIRFTTTDGAHDFEVKKKRRMKIQQNAACLYKN